MTRARLSIYPRRVAIALAMAVGLMLAALPAPAPRAAADSDEGGPRIRFEKTTHDFGDLKSDQKVAFDWRFENAGDSPLTIVGTKTSCGCTMSVVDSEVIEPGAAGTIKVDFNPAGMRGSVRKTLAVTTNDPSRPITRLTIKADITSADVETLSGDHPPISGQSLLMGECAPCHATPAVGKAGGELYAAICEMCHGPGATGDRAPSLRHPSYLDERSDRELSEAIAYGSANPRMPGFLDAMGGPLSAEQVDSLVRLLRDWGPLEDATPSDTNAAAAGGE